MAWHKKKNTTENITSVSYVDLLLSIIRNCQLHTSIYNKRDDFSFHITNGSLLRSNFPSSPAYGVLFHILYDLQGLAPHMNVYSDGQTTFQVNYTNRDASWNACNRYLGNIMIEIGSNQTI